MPSRLLLVFSNVSDVIAADVPVVFYAAVALLLLLLELLLWL
jgi:hypothetical protein